MPEMDGYTASAIIRNELKVTSPIVALTATDVTEINKEIYEGIVDSFILKPFKTSDFYLTLAKYCASVSPYAAKNKAIEFLGGQEDMYNKHVERFRENYKNSSSELMGYLKVGNIEEAQRLAHSIKGLAGTLGMSTLQRTAARLEQTIAEDNSSELTSAIKAFSIALTDVIESHH